MSDDPIDVAPIPTDPIPKDCPVCGARMERDSRDRVTIDVCDDHGVWLDEGELQKLLLAASGDMRRASRTRTRKLLRQQRSRDAAWSLLLG